MLIILSYSNNSSILVLAIFIFILGMLVITNRNTYLGLKLVNRLIYKVLNIILNKVYLGYYILGNTTLYFRPPTSIILIVELIKEFNFISMPPRTILLTLISLKIKCIRRCL